VQSNYNSTIVVLRDSKEKESLATRPKRHTMTLVYTRLYEVIKTYREAKLMLSWLEPPSLAPTEYAIITQLPSFNKTSKCVLDH
jgi:hypothetical protein